MGDRLKLKPKPGMRNGCLMVRGMAGEDEVICTCMGCGREVLVPLLWYFNPGRKPEVEYCKNWVGGGCPHDYLYKRMGAYRCTGFADAADVQTLALECECGKVDMLDRKLFDRGMGMLESTGACPHGNRGCMAFKQFDSSGNVVAECSECSKREVYALEDWLTSGKVASANPACMHGIPERQGCYTLKGRNGKVDGEVVAVCTCGVDDVFGVREYSAKSFASAFSECPHKIIGKREGVLVAVQIAGVDYVRCKCAECGTFKTVPIPDFIDGTVARKYAECWH